MIDTTLQSLTQKPDLGPVTNERGRVWASFRLILIFHSLCFFLSRLFSIVSSSSHFEIIGQFSKKESQCHLCMLYGKQQPQFSNYFYKSEAKYSNTIFDFWISCLTLTRFLFFFTKMSFFLSLRLVVYLSLSLTAHDCVQSG